MGLVDYSDSDEDEEPQSKKRKLSPERADALPPLPAGFRDLYSSTVRTSTQDDPALHSGRKRVTPHVVGNWATHVYLDWCPLPAEQKLLSEILEEIRSTSTAKSDVQSLLENDLGVQLPLHISLSRPLSLKTEQKDTFVTILQDAIDESGVRAFNIQPLDLVWHSNENSTRWFLVMRLQKPPGDELGTMLKACNGIAKKLDQPLLYAGDHAKAIERFHVSIAWSLKSRGSAAPNSNATTPAVSADALKRLQALRINFAEVKVRIGQDVSSIALQTARKN